MHERPTEAERLRLQIAATRARIADAAEALAYRADVPARLKDDIAYRIESARGAASDAATIISDNVSDIASAARPHVEDALDLAADTVATAQIVLSNASIATADGVSDALDSVRARSPVDVTAYVARFPLRLALGSLATGALLGLLWPAKPAAEDDAAA
ncbi:MAG: DUF3618 domain-containing protein [Candidatus Eremiobacteraeota bacterium]|nr:DUF3618 domain-containing protein [Candidatus Eremiobacteraeota bacterium]